MDGVAYTVEVPGSAIPLTYPDLCRVLEFATSHDYAKRASAGEQLKAWEDKRGYLSSLQTVFLDTSLTIEIRFLAIIQLKNSIDRVWRLLPHVPHGIAPDEKALIRQRLFQASIQEAEKNLALHSALVAAKVVRIDFPSNTWPTAISELVGLLRTYRSMGTGPGRQYLAGGLQILLRVIKELASVRIRKDQVSLQSMAPEVTFLLAEIYAESANAWLGYLVAAAAAARGKGKTQDAGQARDAEQVMANSLVALKAIRRLVMTGFDEPHRDRTVQQFWTLTNDHFDRLLGLVGHEYQVPAWYQDQIGKHLLQFTKFHVEMSYQKPASFATLPDAIPLVRAYWRLVANFADVYDLSGGIRVSSSAAAPGLSEIKSKIEGPLLERLALKGLLILRACVKMGFQPVQTFKYRSPEVMEEQRRASLLIRTELLSASLVIEITTALISRLFVFRRADLDLWEESPEEWEHQEQSESGAYEWEVRPCAQKLFLDLLTHFKELLTAPLLEYFGTVSGAGAGRGGHAAGADGGGGGENGDEDGDDRMATKEAVYTALGLAAPHVNKVFNFDALLTSTIVADAQRRRSRLCKVLRRRIAITVSEWVAVGVADSSKALVYELYRHLMNPADECNDQVVRITAARQLKWVVDDIDFKPDAFVPFASDILTWMVALVRAVDIDETKLAILESIRLLVSRLEAYADRFGDFITAALPEIWQESNPDEFMIKQAIIGIFAALVAALGDRSQRYQPLMVPLLSEAARPGTALHGHLIEESLELWHTILTHSEPPLSGPLASLAPLALPVLESGSGTTSTQALDVVQAYILLAPRTMLGDGLRREVVAAVGDMIHDSKGRDQIRLGTGCMEYLIRSGSDLGGRDGLSITLRDLIETGFLPKLLSRLHDAWTASQTTGPNRRLSSLSVTTQGDYFTILARIAVADPDLFCEMLASIGGGSFDAIWNWLSAEWFGYNAGCESIERQKLTMMALTRLLELPARQAAVLSRLQEYFDMWATVITELQDGVVDACDTLVWAKAGPGEPARRGGLGADEDDEGAASYKTRKWIRESELAEADPIHSISSLPFVTERLQALIGRVGGEAAFQAEWACNVDRDVIETFTALTSGRMVDEGGGSA